MAAIPPRRLDEARRQRVSEPRAKYATNTTVTAPQPLPAQNVDLESRLLAALLFDSQLLPEVRHILRFPDGARVRPFYKEAHQQLYQRMCALYDGGEIPEYHTLLDEWIRDTADIDTTERELVNDLMNQAMADEMLPTLREKLVKQWAVRIQKHALRRSATDIATTAAGIAYPNEEQAATGDPVDDLRALADRVLMLATAAAPVERFRLKSISEIRDRPRSAWILPGILQERKLWMIYGDSNTGKSFLALDWGLCWATGTPWQGRELQSGHVIYVCAEGIDGLRDRIDAWLASHDLIDAPNFHVIDDSPNLLESGDVLEVIAQIQTLDTAPICVIFDTLADSMPGGKENDGEDYGIVIRAMRRVQRECGCAVLTVHHTGKDTTKGPRGHDKFRAAMDTAVEISRDETTDDMIIRCNKQRESHYFAPFNLRLQSIALDDYGDVTSCVLVASDNPSPAPSTKSKSVLPASCVEVLSILESCSAGIRPKDIISMLVPSKIKTESGVHWALTKLLEKGRVEKTDGGIWRLL